VVGEEDGLKNRIWLVERKRFSSKEREIYLRKKRRKKTGARTQSDIMEYIHNGNHSLQAKEKVGGGWGTKRSTRNRSVYQREY